MVSTFLLSISVAAEIINGSVFLTGAGFTSTGSVVLVGGTLAIIGSVGFGVTGLLVITGSGFIFGAVGF